MSARGRYALDDRGKYCLGILTASGFICRYSEIVDVVRESGGPFRDLAKSSIRKAVKRSLDVLVKRSYLEKKKGSFPFLDTYSISYATLTRLWGEGNREFIQGIQAVKQHQEMKQENLLAIDLSEHVEREFPNIWDAFLEWQEAMEMLKKDQPYDSVITKCGRCLEILAGHVNETLQLFPEETPSHRMVTQFAREETVKKVRKPLRDDFRAFAHGAYFIYRMRSKVGAHPEWCDYPGLVAHFCVLVTYQLMSMVADLLESAIEE